LDLASERFILHQAGQNSRKLIDRYLFKKRVTPRVAVELAETEAIKAMVACGLDVSILPESALVDARRQGLRIFRIPQKDLKRSLAVVYPHRASAPSARRGPHRVAENTHEGQSADGRMTCRIHRYYR
jgi:DNA-binding transcriptional LysR family regulator